MTPRMLPMAGLTHGKRSPVTCRLKCANACAREVCNESDNPSFRDVAGRALSRRRALGLGAAGAVTLALSACSPEEGAASGTGAPSPSGTSPTRGIAFDAIEPVDKGVDELIVPEGFTWQPILRWGDPLFDDAPDFDLDHQSAAAQEKQFGYNNDFLQILRSDDRRTAVLVCNHEYTNPDLMFPEHGGPDPAERIAISMAAQGLAVVELRRKDTSGPWDHVRGGRRNRRITATTPFELTGPAAGTDLLQTSDDPSGRTVLGTFANCAGGLTPWGTILSGEENFHGYFRARGTSTADRRYGLVDEPTESEWEREVDRFDARTTGYEHEPNRFGYVVEIDPEDPDSTPRKHTSLGRFKHEGATIAIARNRRAVCYSGDDERFDYLYKFVSSGTYRDGGSKADRRANLELLTEGDLFVARFDGNSDPDQIDGSGALPKDGAFDGTGRWIPLVKRGRSRVPGMSIEEVLVHTRLAADTVGATKMDRCEDVEPHPTTGKVYVACTNNDERGTKGMASADEVNPRTTNRDGHVVEITEQGGNAAAERFSWNLLLVCGDPADTTSTYFGGYPPEKVSPISCPDNLTFDGAGNLWISTDGAPDSLGFNDGLFRVGLEGDRRGLVEQFLSLPREAETCGPLVHDDDGMVFISVQHPGEEGTFAEPHSLFPDYVKGRAADGEVKTPRPSVVQVTRTA